ncbi:hypothetical protein QBC34DRAFT_297569 [Podospora aff. communis PSN243]|uniref:Uncharacterized protein n=1 Tax=Podospora aff. communis PSN243 TaxID=3040156 RepID=A0AAV9GSJ3_9PEZI|nr:hypothetical protein QBC34DRAFT_297569 [Podospora aff. communis PSN243]
MPGSPTVFAANIPKITSLRKDLDYDDARLPRCAAFNDDTRAFRRKFKTSRGVNGVDLHDWKSEATQAGLNEMTTSYLDRQGNGQLFWPDDRSSQNYNKYQYSKHRDHIRRLVKQLFFRLNQQQFRNQKYKHKQNPDATEEEDSGYHKDASVDLDTITIATSHDDPIIPIETDTISTHHEPGKSSDGPPAVDGRDMDEDWYEVPESRPSSPLSPSPHTQQFEPIQHQTRPKRPHVTPTNLDAQTQQAKRQKQTATDMIPNQKRESSRTNKSQGVRRAGYVVGADAIKSMSKAVSPDRTIDSSQHSDTTRGVHDDRRTLFNPASDDKPTRPRRMATPEPPPFAARKRGERTGEFTPVDPDLSRSSLPSRARAERGSESPSALRRLPSPDLSSRETHVPGQSEIYSKVDPLTIEARTEDTLTGPTQVHLNNRQQNKQPRPPMRQSNMLPAITTPNIAQGSRPGTSTGVKPSINFLYRVVLARTPKTITERWNPEGKFQDKTLADLLNELPFQDRDAQGLVFTVESECMKIVERIVNDDEDGFASMKRYINREIKEWFRRQKRVAGGTPPKLVVDIIIERMGTEKEQEADMLDDSDLELEW